MRNITLLFALLVVLAVATSPTTAATKVFLLGGQSNMAGYMTGLPTTSPYDAPLPDVQFWNLSGTGWVDLDVGFGDTTNDIGPEVGFGHALNSLYPDDDIYLVKYGIDSTSLAVQWNPDGSGSAYNTFKSRVDAAMLNLAGQSPEIAGMIWMQGESDAANPTYGDAYASNLTNFIGNVRNDFSTPSMPFVVGRISDILLLPEYAGTFPKAAEVRTAQETVPGVVGSAEWIDTDDIEQNLPTYPGHYTAAGQVVLGTRFANTIATIDPDPLPDPVPVPSGSMGASFDVGSGVHGANNNTIGWRFKAAQDLTVTRLGCLNGVPTTGNTQAGVSHAVSIYDEATQELLGSAVVVNGAVDSTDQWMWTDIAAPISLTAGKIYRIATYANGDKWTYNTTGHSVGPGILIGTDLAPGVDPSIDPGSRVAAYFDNVVEQVTGTHYPNDTSIWTIEGIWNGFYGANFKYVDTTDPGTRGAHGTGTHTVGAAAPTLPANNLIVQGSDTLSGSFNSGETQIAGDASFADMNNGVMTPSEFAPSTILQWEGDAGNYGWAVYELDTTTNTAGYNISELLSYAGWTDERIYQAIEIKYALVGDTITPGEELGRTLGSFSYIPTDDITDYGYSTLSITNDEDPLVLSGVSAIEVKYIDNLFDGSVGGNGPGNLGNFTAYKQFAVIGTPRVLGDANDDGNVDVSDLGILAANYGTSSGKEWGDGDFTGEGAVDISDLGILAAYYGTTSSAAAIPEPSTFAGLLGLCLTGIFTSVRRKHS
ncbi:MAG: DUF4082 domain-containing protein [Pirellulales bacterium]|nr:DUF4082 domain-containing protein [Pirellulales bacterium]